jgi:hypothetical protein
MIQLTLFDGEHIRVQSEKDISMLSIFCAKTDNFIGSIHPQLGFTGAYFMDGKLTTEQVQAVAHLLNRIGWKHGLSM